MPENYIYVWNSPLIYGISVALVVPENYIYAWNSPFIYGISVALVVPENYIYVRNLPPTPMPPILCSSPWLGGVPTPGGLRKLHFFSSLRCFLELSENFSGASVGRQGVFYEEEKIFYNPDLVVAGRGRSRRPPYNYNYIIMYG